MKHEGMGSDVAGRLEAYVALLGDRAIPLGLISESDRGRLWERHIADSLRAVSALKAEDSQAYDLGSGAGLPGIVVAIAEPALSVTLVESRGNRAAFLELAVERLRLANATVAPVRAEGLQGLVDLCFARAFADARRSWEVASRLLRPAGRLVYFGGGRFRLDRDVPEGASAHVLDAGPIERSGPLVIMSRQ